MDGVLVEMLVILAVAGVGLHAGVDDVVGGKIALVDIGGAFELFVHGLAHVGAKLRAAGAEVVRLAAVALDIRGVGLGSLARVEAGGQLLIDNLDEIDGALRRSLGGGADGGNGIAAHADLGLAEDLLVAVADVRGLLAGEVLVGALAVAADLDVREVLARQHALDAGIGLGLGGVDGDDARVCDGRELGLGIEHVGGVKVAGVHGAAGDLVIGLDVLIVGLFAADKAIVLRLAEVILVCKSVHAFTSQPMASISAETAWMASTILT